MSTSSPSPSFDKDHAAAYDQRFAKLDPMRDALHSRARCVWVRVRGLSC
ncbi:hypothetical protein OKA05_16655 [Luteolibacter arcticus]|uniref:Uncharacterized protein n=1 Tax=Luteolibacter arcticus TaxID=1581411 RepID=A0ABT3GL12_9BACT|nr:hypothetical protein [Luteolibacter arcticus]MCW1924199.1 hypothetical protein [Luteolibacter arcticus]